jgi:hypothetical protein
MKGGGAMLLLWGGLGMGGLEALYVIFADESNFPWLPLTFFGFACATCVLAGLVLVVRDRLRREPEPLSRTEVVPDLSLGAALVGVGLAVGLPGMEFGPWMYILGAMLVVAGVLRLAVEWRADRRHRRTLEPLAAAARREAASGREDQLAEEAALAAQPERAAVGPPFGRGER